MDLAILVLAIAVLVVVLVSVVLGRRLDIRVGRMSATVEGMRPTVEGIDRAVNQRPPGEPPLTDDVRQVREDMAIVRGSVTELTGRFDQHLAYHAGLEAGRPKE